MTPDDRFDGTVSVWLQNRAGTGTPDYLDDILGRTARTRQRPGWLSIERWPPMDISATRTVLPSRFPMRSVALFAILALLLAAIVAVAVGSRQQRLPAPFGPAANGSVVYGGVDGDLYAIDTATRASRPLVSGPDFDESPEFAPNGTQFVFARQLEGRMGWRLMLANADGSDVRALTGVVEPATNGWSPDSRHIAVADILPVPARLTVYPVDGSAPVDLPVEMTVNELQWRSDAELVFLGHAGDTYGLYVVGIDGSEPRPILPVTAAETDWIQPVVSPDGSQVAYTRWIDGPTIHVVDIESGVDRTVSYDGSNLGDGWPTAWSPDGTKFVFTRWSGTENHLAVGSVEGGSVVETGPGFPDFTHGAIGLFSPDGRQVIARYGKETDTTWLLDAAGGAGERLVTNIPFIATWQRVALP